MSLTPTVVEKLTPQDEGTREARSIRQGRALAELLRRQHGVVARSQLAALGLNRGAIDWRIRAGRLHRVHRGVYAAAPSRLSLRGQLLAAVLASGEGAVLSHRSAAALWGLAGARGDVDVTSVHGRPGRPGIRLHRVAIPADQRTRRDDIPTTTVARTLLDLAGVLDARQLKRVWEEADRLRLLRLGPVVDACNRAGRRRGVGTIRRLVADAEAATATRSPLEDRVLSLCRKHGLPLPATNVEVLGREVDGYWPAARLVVEADGFDFHRHRAAFERDRSRDAAMLAAGYRVVRLTHRRLEDEPEIVATQLRRLLAAD